MCVQGQESVRVSGERRPPGAHRCEKTARREKLKHEANNYCQHSVLNDPENRSADWRPAASAHTNAFKDKQTPSNASGSR